MKIVNLIQNDIDSILLLESGFKDGWSSNQLKSAFESGRFFAFGVKDGEHLIAFTSYSQAIDQADIETVFVREDYRRKGIAKRLLQMCEEEMKKAGVKKTFLEVRESNALARILYEKLGYKVISTRKNYYLDGENAVVMLKELL